MPLSSENEVNEVSSMICSARLYVACDASQNARYAPQDQAKAGTQRRLLFFRNIYG